MKRRRSLLLVCLAGALALTPAGCGGDGGETAEPAAAASAAVPTALATLSTEPIYVSATGTVEPWSRVSPGTKVLARVEEVPVRVGERVRQGAILARLERRDLEAGVRQAEAAVAMAEAELENAEAQYRRIVDLHQRGSVTEKNLEDVTAARRLASAGVDQARANLAAAEVTLDYAVVRSPVSGWVTAKHVEAGDMSAPGQPMFTIEDLTRVKVRLDVTESDVVGLQPADPVRVTVDVLRRSWQARIQRINPAGDPVSRTYRVELVLDNPEGTLKSGMFARAALPGGLHQILLVPSTAVAHRGQLEGLFVVDGDRIARLRWVRLGRELDSRVEVLSGLEPGEIFVVAPPPGFADGTRVEER